jgi:DNA-binding HxlR family transcriptional regulator
MGNYDPIIPRVPFEMCPIRSSLGVLGKKWTLLVMRDVAFYGLIKFSQILKNNRGLTPRVLSLRLLDLRKDGLIERVSDPKDQRVVQYRLTKKGNDTIPILTAFIQYGAQYHSEKVFEDGKPHQLAELFPEERKVMLGRLLSYARGARSRTRPMIENNNPPRTRTGA